jgi:hypothetical protein
MPKTSVLYSHKPWAIRHAETDVLYSHKPCMAIRHAETDVLYSHKPWAIRHAETDVLYSHKPWAIRHAETGVLYSHKPWLWGMLKRGVLYSHKPWLPRVWLQQNAGLSCYNFNSVAMREDYFYFGSDKRRMFSLGALASSCNNTKPNIKKMFTSF